MEIMSNILNLEIVQGWWSHGSWKRTFILNFTKLSECLCIFKIRVLISKGKSSPLWLPKNCPFATYGHHYRKAQEIKVQLLKSDPEETYPTQLPYLRLRDSCRRVRERTARAWDKGVHHEIVFPRNVKSDTNNISPLWHLKHEQKKNNIRHAKED